MKYKDARDNQWMIQKEMKTLKLYHQCSLLILYLKIKTKVTILTCFCDYYEVSFPVFLFPALALCDSGLVLSCVAFFVEFILSFPVVWIYLVPCAFSIPLCLSWLFLFCFL